MYVLCILSFDLMWCGQSLSARAGFDSEQGQTIPSLRLIRIHKSEFEIGSELGQI